MAAGLAEDSGGREHTVAAEGDSGGSSRPNSPVDALFQALKKWSEKQTGGAQSKSPKKKGESGGLSRRSRTILWIVGGLVLLAVVALIASNLWTDVLWFQEVGFVGIFWTRIWARVIVGIVGAAVFFAVFYLNLRLARRLSPRIRLSQAAGDEEPEILELVPTQDRTVNRLLLIGSLVIAFFFALGTAAAWEDFLLYFNRVAFGYSDPIFNQDASFYVFVLPIFRRLLGYLTAVILVTLIAVIVLYLFDRAISTKEGKRGLELAPHVKAHLSVLAAVLLLGKAADFMLQAWELVYSSRGVVIGASYTDISALLPVLRILAIVAVLSAVILLVNIYYRGWMLPLIAVGLLFLVWLGAGKIYPAIVQQYRVSPNEIEMETPFIDYNINATRWAFGLDKVTRMPFPASQVLTMADIEANKPTIDNIRLWDPRPLLEAYAQLQAIRLYYSFRDVDVDRYVVDGDYRQVMLSGRELDQNKLQNEAKTWVNEHLTYTHGYGAVVGAVNESEGDGLPTFLVENIPPQTETNLVITRPEIYYGEIGTNFVMVSTTANEFDYPKGDENVFATYEGTGGVNIASFWRQLAFTIRFSDLKLMFSQYLTPESRIMYKRTIQERVHSIAPFLQFDSDPYMVIRDDGSLVWIWDAYTTSDRFPFSQPSGGGLNYIRNSIKVIIDAYNGSVTLYQINPDDALATTWGRVYPELLRPGSELPEDLRRHLRYPEDMFSIQADKLTIYHMESAQTFYNKEDVWQIPTEIYFNEEVPVVPYYVIMGLPGEQKEEFLLLQPFSPLDKKNMVAWMGGRMDGDKYGEIIVFQFPKDKLVFGPSQIEARISNDPAISAQLTLWNQSGSRVIRGNLLVIPIEDSILYVEPMYLQADQSPIPELKRVIVSYNDNVVMEPTLAEALESIFAGGTPPTTEPPSTTTTTGPGTTTTTTPPSTTTTTGGALPTDPAELILLAQDLYEQAVDAQRAGNWTEYGRLIEELGTVLDILAAVTGQ